MMVAFSEMMKIQSDAAKEDKIQIKTRYIEWGFYLTYQFFITTKTWLNYPLLQKSDLAPEVGSLFYWIFFRYHNIVSFLLFTAGMMFFVLSLQEGFYAYQFKRLGWSLLSTFSIVNGGTGLMIALWGNRLWFFYAITCITIHNAVDYIFCRYFPLKSSMLLLKLEATIEGFLAGSVSCFIYFFIVSIFNQLFINVF